MGRQSDNGGVIAIRDNRIRYDFTFEGVRYRPSVRRTPTEINLRRAREHLRQIKARIRAGTFSFVEEFPEFKDLHRVIGTSNHRTCDQVFDEFLHHCESRVRRGELAAQRPS